MSEGKIAHDLSWLGDHGSFVLAEPQTMFDGTTDIRGVREDDATFSDCEVRRGVRAVLPGPGIDGIEKRLMRLQKVCVTKLPALRQCR